jgi:hypothetical protein
MKIWVLFGMTGEYSDRQEWPVRAYKDQAEAQAARERCDAYAHSAPDYWHETYETRGKYVANNPDDPSMCLDYTGTEYGIYELELV